MKHIIVIMAQSKKKTDGRHRFFVKHRYELTEADICEQETKTWNEDIDEDDKFKYYAEIEQTIHD